MVPDDVIVDTEFAGLCPALTAEERSLLEASVIADGCREPLVVWEQEKLLLDGHNRLGICRTNEIDYEVRGLRLANREEALNWIIANQLGRRNLSEEQKSYLRGKRYIAEKKKEGAPARNANAKKQRGQSDQVNLTSQKLSAEYGVGEKTIRRDAAYAKAVDKLADAAGSATKTKLLSGEIKATKADVIAVAKLPQETAKKVVESGSRAIRSAANRVIAAEAVGGKIDDNPTMTAHQYAKDDPARRWAENLYKIYVLFTSLRDCGGIEKLTREWPPQGRAHYITELRRIRGEIDKYIEIMESVK